MYYTAPNMENQTPFVILQAAKLNNSQENVLFWGIYPCNMSTEKMEAGNKDNST